MREQVVLVPGFWMLGFEMLALHRELKRCGLPSRIFYYRSVYHTPRQNAQRLAQLLSRLDADVVHLVGHSLGGIVLLHLFDLEPVQRPGRVLMLGTPLNGSEIIRRVHRRRVLRLLLGRCTVQGLLGDAPPWRGGRTLGMIAGTRGIGLGNVLFGGLSSPNDGSVAVSETRAPEVNLHLTVPYSHVGMLWSAPVRQAVCRFLKTGDFAD